MKAGMYPKLAYDGIRKNSRMYLPYILTCVGMVAMYYIIAFLQFGKALDMIPGTETARSMMSMGNGIIAVFAGIFLFYTNSFLIRRRKKEFGLYNILGMGKRNIAVILFWETLIIYGLSLAAGLVSGIAFSKLAELGYVNILKAEISYTLSVSSEAVLMTAAVFSVIFLLLFLNALRQIRFSTAVSLMKSENAGEKPPKGNWFLGALGVLILAGAYYIAVSIKDPVTALAWFFIAVVMVIVGTYLLMIAGSVLFCRILQKRKKYYYKSNHFVSVSSMVYRMKRNGAGLASICILATMVLVMISSTAALYFGCEDSMKERYPREINSRFIVTESEEIANENLDVIRSKISEIAENHGAKVQNVFDYRYAYFGGALTGNTVETDPTKYGIYNTADFSNIYQIFFVSLKDYNEEFGTDYTLGENEALIYCYRNEYTEKTLTINHGRTFNIKNQVDKFFKNSDASAYIGPTMALIVPDLDSALQGLENLVDFKGDNLIQYRFEYGFDTGLNASEQVSLSRDLSDVFDDSESKPEGNFKSALFECREINRDDIYGLYGGIFYLGIMLSIVFIFATVLIIYYKQISEGYEDRTRFEIMQKVGMTKKEIRKSINSQLLTVFFLPLIGAGVHLAFAFPIIQKLLVLFNLNNVVLFVTTTVISFLIFALFYTIVYRLTSNAYYNIVSGAKED